MALSSTFRPVGCSVIAAMASSGGGGQTPRRGGAGTPHAYRRRCERRRRVPELCALVTRVACSKRSLADTLGG